MSVWESGRGATEERRRQRRSREWAKKNKNPTQRYGENKTKTTNNQQTSSPTTKGSSMCSVRGDALRPPPENPSHLFYFRHLPCAPPTTTTTPKICNGSSSNHNSNNSSSNNQQPTNFERQGPSMFFYFACILASGNGQSKINGKG